LKKDKQAIIVPAVIGGDFYF